MCNQSLWTKHCLKTSHDPEESVRSETQTEAWKYDYWHNSVNDTFGIPITVGALGPMTEICCQYRVNYNNTCLVMLNCESYREVVLG